MHIDGPGPFLVMKHWHSATKMNGYKVLSEEEEKPIKNMYQMN